MMPRKQSSDQTPAQPVSPQEPEQSHGVNGHGAKADFPKGDWRAWRASHNARIAAGERIEYTPKAGNAEVDQAEKAEARAAARAKKQPRWPRPFRGAMRDAVEATLAASNKPRPCVAMGAVLAGMGAAVPATHCTEDGMRLNLFVSVAVDPSGGKDTPRLVAQAIAAAAGVRHEGAPASGAALERMLEHYMTLLLPIDESAQMQGAKKDRGAQHYSKDLIDVLLKLFSASKTSYSTRAYADSKKGDQRRLIWHPCINLLMFATDFGVARSLDSGSIRTGELPRQLFINDTVPVKHRRAPRFELPESVRDVALRLRLLDTERASLIADGGEKPDLHRPIAESEQAKRLLDLVMERHDGKDAYGGDAPLGVMLASRHFEKVLRVAGVLAVWDNPQGALMTGRHVAWAERFVTACDLAMANYYATEVHETPQGADIEYVRRALQAALDGKGGQRAEPHREHIKEGIVPRSLVMYLARGMSANRLTKKPFDEAVATLEELGEVSTRELLLGERTGKVVQRGETWEDR
jgi:Protein of unknown function (DUF3987)